LLNAEFSNAFLRLMNKFVKRTFNTSVQIDVQGHSKQS